MNFAMTPEMLAQLRANMGVPPIPPPAGAPTLRETLRAETPTLRRGAELAGRGAKAAWGIAKPALPFGVGAAIPAMELYREWDVIGDPDASLGDRLAATGRTAARTALTGGGLLIGSRVGHPYVGAGVGGALAAALVPDRDEPALPGIGSAQTAPPPAEAAPPADRKDDGFRFYEVQPGKAAAASPAQQQPGPVMAAPAVEGQLMPRTGIDWTQIDRERERMDELMQRYAAGSGEKVPSKLSAMDKFQILAKGLGVAAVMSAFPGFGLLAVLGAGALGAGDELGRRRAALAKGDSDARAEERQRMKDLAGMSAGQVQNVMDMTKMDLAREDEAYQRLDRNRRFNLDAQKAMTAGYQPVQAADGSLIYWNPATGAQVKAPGSPVASNKGVSFSIPNAVTARAKIFQDQGDTVEESFRKAYESLAPELAAQGIRLPARQPTGYVPGYLEAYQQYGAP